MFLLRCIFWLSVVYSSMTWTNVSLQTASAARLPASAPLANLEDVARGLGRFCMHHGAACAADADLVTSLMKAEPVLAQRREEPASADIPMPVPDPRRHANPQVARAL